MVSAAHNEKLITTLRNSVGKSHVLVGGDLSAWTIDQRKRYHGKALAVVLPANTAEVAEVVRICADAGVSIVPQGGNTGTVGGSVPDESGQEVLLCLSRLKHIREVDAANLTLTVEAGCTLHQVQQAAAAAGMLFPLSLYSEGSCTLGGNLASNAGGTQVLRYGNARELCLGLEVVTAAGEVWEGLSGLRKDNAGYDLRDLFIGSEGTLGIITAATLRLYPRPACVLTAMLECKDIAACVASLAYLRTRLGSALTGFEVMNSSSLKLVAEHFPALVNPVGSRTWAALIEVSDAYDENVARPRFEAVLAHLLTEGICSEVALAQSHTQAQGMWELRGAIPLAQTLGGLNVKHDISLPLSRVPAFLSEVDTALRAGWPRVTLVTFGHLGDGNLHYNVQAPQGIDAAAFLATHEADINKLVFDAVMRFGGSIAAEHGIGRLRRDELARRKPAVALSMMHAIKQALDPKGLLNPGRVL